MLSQQLSSNAIRRPLEYIKKQFGVDITYLPLKDDELSQMRLRIQ